MGQNKLVQVGAIIVGVFALLLLMKSCKGGDTPEEQQVTVGGGDALSPEAIAGLGIEADTEQDVVATLIGEVRDMRETMDNLRRDNAALRDDNAKLKGMEQSIERRVEGRLGEASAEVEESATAQFDQMMARLEQAERRLAQVNHRAGATPPRNAASAIVGNDGAGTVWVQPLGRQVTTEGVATDQSGGFLNSLNGARNDLSDHIGVRRLPGVRDGRRDLDAELPEPFYTIPRNATLVGSTAMTALIGRVPLSGQVTDPYSFKVIIGEDNLMANGLELPEVAYAIASGKAVGDWTLGCVRGDIQSLTFVFDDGTIETIPDAPDVSNGSANQRTIKIGELSDQFGNPCVLGQRISNSAQYLSQRIGVVAVQAAAEAAAASQTTQVTSFGGGGAGVGTIVDGATGEYILGRSIADGANEVARWLDERQAQQFDAIYVAPGANVAMHITQQLNIDYDPAGRKTNYAAFRKGGTRALD